LIKWIQQFQTSKIITYIFLIFYLLFMIASAIVFSIWGINLTQFIDYLQSILMIIILSYFTKSTLENFTSIKTASQETIQSTIQDTKVQEAQINANVVPNNTTTTETITSNENEVPTEITTTTEVVNTDSTLDTINQNNQI